MQQLKHITCSTNRIPVKRLFKDKWNTLKAANLVEHHYTRNDIRSNDANTGTLEYHM